MSNTVHLTINHLPLEVPAGTRIIEAAKMLNIDIPHLCYHPDQTIKAHCRMCMVEVTGQRKLLAACSTVVWEGMEVFTDTKKVYDATTSRTACPAPATATASCRSCAAGSTACCPSCPTSPPTSLCALTIPPSCGTPPSASSAAAA